MKCLICGSEGANWVETIMHNETEGTETRECELCRGRSEIGFEIVQYRWNGKNNVFPFEVERSR